MDTLSKLNEVKDVDLQALLGNSLRYSLHHNMIASQAELQVDNPNAPQAVILHRDTANLLRLMVEKILELTPAAPPPKTGRTKKKAA